MSTIIQLTGFLRPCTWRIIGAVFLGAGTIIAGIGLLASSGYLISAAALRPPILDLMVVIVAVRFFGISRAVLRYSERLLSHDITFRLLMQLRSRFFRIISNLPASRLSYFRSGALLSSITTDVDELQNYYIRVFTPVIIAVIVTTASTGFIYGYSPPAALATLLLLTVSGAVVPFFVRKLARGLGNKQVELRTRLHHLWVEQSQGMQEVRLFGLQKKNLDNVSQVSDEIARLERRQSFITGLQDTLFNWLMYSAVFIALLVTVPMVLNGELSGALLALVLFGVMGSFEATQNLGTAFQYLESTEKAAANLMELSDDTEANSTDYRENEELKNIYAKVTPTIFYKDITFAYDQKKVLEDISFAVGEGSHKAIVGPTGSGKSTLLNLLMKFHKPDCGAIFLGDKNLKYFAPEQVRSRISVVDQQTYIFNDSLRSNLVIAYPEADDSALHRILEKVELGPWYQTLPHGLDTILGEHGKSMSGGERQRLALGRALLKDTGVWVLDEPTANLDTLTEHTLHRLIKRVTVGKTVLWITHRLVEMTHFDSILVISQGNIIERGDHATLMRKKGWYYSMIQLQENLIPDDPYSRKGE